MSNIPTQSQRFNPASATTPLTVSQLTQMIKQHLETQFRTIFLQGEISNFTKQASSGHLYFSLKDANAQIGALMFRSDAIRVNPPPKAGDHVMIKGEISVYPPQGSYKIVVKELYYVGLGALLLKFEQLKNKLAQQGWFAAERKKTIPKFPKIIGVITSPTGAVIQDMLHVLRRRFPGFHLLLNPVRVQGEGAAEEIASAIRFFNQQANVDVIILARGGGSLEDLWPFNEEIVASAIYASTLPIISAVGHETDFSLSDFVADLRAPTPTAAAQLAVPEKALIENYLIQSKRRIQHSLAQTIRHHRQQLISCKRDPIFTSSRPLLSYSIQRLDDIVQRLDHSFQLLLNEKKLTLIAYRNQIKAVKPAVQHETIKKRLLDIQKALSASMVQKMNQLKRQIDYLDQGLNSKWRAKMQLWHTAFEKWQGCKMIHESWRKWFLTRSTQLQHLQDSLQSVDPRNLLKKGYSILVAENDHTLMTSTKDFIDHPNVKAYLSDGTINLTINKKKVKSSQPKEP